MEPKRRGERVGLGNEQERVKAKLFRKSHGGYFFWPWHKAQSNTGIPFVERTIFHRELFCFDRWPLVDYDAGTERPFWPRRDGNPLVEVEVLLKERLPVHVAVRIGFFYRRSNTHGAGRKSGS